jgi:hypothetical protein
MFEIGLYSGIHAEKAKRYLMLKEMLAYKSNRTYMFIKGKLALIPDKNKRRREHQADIRYSREG